MLIIEYANIFNFNYHSLTVEKTILCLDRAYFPSDEPFEAQGNNATDAENNVPEGIFNFGGDIDSIFGSEVDPNYDTDPWPRSDPGRVTVTIINKFLNLRPNLNILVMMHFENSFD